MTLIFWIVRCAHNANKLKALMSEKLKTLVSEELKTNS